MPKLLGTSRSSVPATSRGFGQSDFLFVVAVAIRGMGLRLRAKRRWVPLPEAGTRTGMKSTAVFEHKRP
jgi:hypothetical protein